MVPPPPFPPDTHSTDPHPPICIQSKTTSILIHVLTRAYPSALLLFFHLPISSSSRAIFISVYHRASHSAASKNLFIMLRYYFSQTLPKAVKRKRKSQRITLDIFPIFHFLLPMRLLFMFPTQIHTLIKTGFWPGENLSSIIFLLLL